MADRKIEPVAVTVNDTSSSAQTQNAQTAPSSRQEAQQSRPESSEGPSANTSCVRNSVLDEVVAHQEQRISELERKVEKKKETFRILSTASPFIPPPGLGVAPPQAPPQAPPPPVPPGSAAAPAIPATLATPATSATPAVQPAPSQPNPVSNVGNAVSTSPQQQSQPLAQNPAMAATMAAIAAASTPSVSAALHPPYPFFPYPHPDNPVLTPPLLGVVPPVPPHAAAPPLQPPVSTPPTSQPNQASEDGTCRQSRYWTPDEHQRFLAARNACGEKNYAQISEYVGTRSPRQVRTHSQKYQKKLEREEARRRRDGRAHNEVHSHAPAVGTVVGVMHSTLPGTTTVANHLRPSDTSRGGTAKAGNKNSLRADTLQSVNSAEGSSSTNNMSSEGNAENSVDAAHAGAKAAAAAAVRAEAAALGRGQFPPGAISMLPKPQVTVSSSTHLQTKKIRPREIPVVKPNRSHVLPTPNGAFSTGVGKAAECRLQVTSQSVARPIPNGSHYRGKIAPTVPAARGVESGQIAKHVALQKSQGAVGANAKLGSQADSSVEDSLNQAQTSTGHKPSQKAEQSTVKTEAKLVTSMLNKGQSSAPNTSVTLGPSKVSAAPTMTRLKPATKVVDATCSNSSVAKPSPHKDAENKRISMEGKAGSNGSVTLTKNTPVAVIHKSNIVPNGGDHSVAIIPSGIGDVSSQVDGAAENSGDNRSSRRPQSTSASESPSRKQPNDQTPMKVSTRAHSEVQAKNGLGAQNTKEADDRSGTSKANCGEEATQDEVIPESARKPHVDTCDDPSNRDVEPISSSATRKDRETESHRDSMTAGCVKPSDRLQKCGPTCRASSSPVQRDVIIAKDIQPDDYRGVSSDIVGGSVKKIGNACDTQMKEQGLGGGKRGLTPNGTPQVEMSSGTGGGEKRKEAGENKTADKDIEMGECDENEVGEVDRKVESRGVAQGGAIENRFDEGKVGNEMKRSLEDGNESVAKRQKGSDEGDMMDTERGEGDKIVDAQDNT